MTSCTTGRQEPHLVPAPLTSPTSSTDLAPFSTARLMWRSLMRLQWQTIMAQFLTLKVIFNSDSGNQKLKANVDFSIHPWNINDL
jgi:hypothetical protein